MVLDSVSNALPALAPFAPHILNSIAQLLPRRLYILAPDGTLKQL
jgi:hypothetical protein